MKMSTLLTAMALLVGAAETILQENLNSIFEKIPKLNWTSSMNYYVEDVEHLAGGVNKCGDPFFCKVHDILLHKNFSKMTVEEKNLEEEKKPKMYVRKSIERELENKIERELKAYINNRKVNCSLALKNVSSSNITIAASQFWDKVKGCIQKRNFQGHD